MEIGISGLSSLDAALGGVKLRVFSVILRRGKKHVVFKASEFVPGDAYRRARDFKVHKTAHAWT